MDGKQWPIFGNVYLRPHIPNVRILGGSVIQPVIITTIMIIMIMMMDFQFQEFTETGGQSKQEWNIRHNQWKNVVSQFNLRTTHYDPLLQWSPHCVRA